MILLEVTRVVVALEVQRTPNGVQVQLNSVCNIESNFKDILTAWKAEMEKETATGGTYIILYDGPPQNNDDYELKVEQVSS